MRERGHQIGCAVAPYPTVCRYQIEIADRRHDAGIGFLLGGDQQRPICRVCDVFEQVDRWKGTADNPYSTFPLDLGNRNRLGIKDRQSVVEGKSVYVRVDLGVRRIIKKKTEQVEMM